ncbi:MAG: alpha/beta hydrolase [Chloroflexi bacterium]|nr:alpha/beta hydrolase [Chloroflexota bacterium]
MTAEVKRTDDYVFQPADYVWRPDGGVHYSKVGRGDPLILLHNFELSSFIWRRVIDKFAEHFTCYRIDLPGHGYSDIPPRKYAMNDYAKAIIDVMDKLGIPKADIVASHGGCLAGVEMAVSYPQRVKKIVFDGVPYWNKERGRAVFEGWWKPMFTDTTWCDIPVIPVRTWEEVVKRNPNSPFMDREHFEESEAVARKSRRWIRLSFESLTSYDVEEAGPKIKAPVLMINGEKDMLRRGEKRALEGIKGSVLKVVEGVRPHWNRPDEFAKLTLDFLLARG